MATLFQNQPLMLEFQGVSAITLDFASITTSPGYSYSAGGVVQYSAVPVCAWCGTYGGNWGLYWNKTQETLTVDFGKLMDHVRVVLYPTHGTSTMTLVQDAPLPAPVPLPAAGGLLGAALMGVMVWKKLARQG